MISLKGTRPLVRWPLEFDPAPSGEITETCNADVMFDLNGVRNKNSDPTDSARHLLHGVLRLSAPSAVRLRRLKARVFPRLRTGR